MLMVRSYYAANLWVSLLMWINKVTFDEWILELCRNPPDGVSVGLGEDENIYKWEMMIIGPPDTLYEGGFFKAKLDFPPSFPNLPPVMTFTTNIWHPNGMF